MHQRFVQANNSNLPTIDACMIALFFKNNPDFYAAELRNVKTAISGRESYGDDAIGYVQLHREHGVCTVKCKVCPEHKVRNKPYNVTLTINENDSEIITCQCHDCAASAGGCKHAVAFLMWVHRRSEEPASTSVDCYWRKPTLSKVGTTLKYITVEKMSTKPVPHRFSNSNVYTEFISVSKKKKIENCELLRYQEDFQQNNVLKYSLHHLIMNQPSQIKSDVDKFINEIRKTLSLTAVRAVEEAIRRQSKSSMWYEMRYGRITASKAHEVSVCNTPDGSLVATIMGAKIPDTVAMKRGRNLELSVLKIVSKKLKKKIKSCGLYLCHENPMLAASPDGLVEDAVIEIKCPSKAKTIEKYIKNGVISEKCKAQIQLQMYATGMKKCYFCVAESQFEETKNVDIIVMEYDSEYVDNLISNLVNFWKTNIFPILFNTTI